MYPDAKTTDTETFYKIVGEALWRLRQRSGLTLEEAVRRMGKKPSTAKEIERWERGETDYGMDELWDYLESIDADLHDLVHELIEMELAEKKEPVN